jgi:hypothetical protein
LIIEGVYTQHDLDTVVSFDDMMKANAILDMREYTRKKEAPKDVG